jgi:hypothetical protein
MTFNFHLNETGDDIDAYIFEYRGHQVTIHTPKKELTSREKKAALLERLSKLRKKYSALSSRTWPSEGELLEITALCFVLTGGKTGWESPDHKIDQVIRRINRRNRKLKLSSFFADVAVRLLNIPQSPACMVHSLLLDKALTDAQREGLKGVHKNLSGENLKLVDIEDIKGAETACEQLLQITSVSFKASLQRGSDMTVSGHKQNISALAKLLSWAAHVDLLLQQVRWNARYRIEDLKPSISFISSLSSFQKAKDVRSYYSGIASPEPPSPEERKKRQNAARQRAFWERKKSA